MRVILTSKTQSQTESGTIKVIFPVAFNCRKVYLTSVSIPYSFYNIRETNNTVIINNIEHSIPPKNYNSIQLAAAVSFILPTGASCVFDRQTLKYTIVSDSDMTIRFPTSNRIFGFHDSEMMVSAGTSILSPFIADINDGLQALILTSNIANSFSTLYNDKFGTQIIARIPLSQFKQGSMIYFEDRNNNQPIVSDIKQLQFIEILLLDDNLKKLSLEGVEFQVELFIELENEVTIKDLRISSKLSEDDEK